MQPSSRPSCCRTRILCSTGAPQASLKPSPVPQALSAFWSWWWRALLLQDLGWGQEGLLFSLTQIQCPYRQLGLGSGMEGEVGMFVPLFLGKEHEQLG